MVFCFPNETADYRKARDRLLDEEVRLREEIERVAGLRRQLPPGGRLKEDYLFERMTGDGQRETIPFVKLFGDHDTLLLYTLMFGHDWDAPCPSCTCIADSINVNSRAVEESATIAIVSAASAEQLADWSGRRGWYMNVVSAENSRYVLDYAGFDTDDAAAVSCMNVFRKTDDGIFHFWASELLNRPMANGHPRHVDIIWPMWNLLDMTPEGRGNTMVPKQNFEHRVFTERYLGKP